MFEKTGVLLVGSENLYTPSSSFSEVMIETFVPETDRQRVGDVVFSGLRSKLLLCKYGVKDLRIHGHRSFGVGMPFVPCNIEVDHWDLIANVVTLDPNGPRYPTPERHWPGRLYAVFEFMVSQRKHYLAIDRGYGYCGDLDEEAFNWLMENCSILHFDENYDGGLFPEYHPIPKNRLAERAVWFGAVKDQEKHESLKVTVKQVDITHRKIRRQDSLTTED
jgi:hypothetical protein